MLEKLLLAATITFSLNMFVQVRVPLQDNSERFYPLQRDTTPQILVNMPRKYNLAEN